MCRVLGRCGGFLPVREGLFWRGFFDRPLSSKHTVRAESLLPRVLLPLLCSVHPQLRCLQLPLCLIHAVVVNTSIFQQCRSTISPLIIRGGDNLSVVCSYSLLSRVCARDYYHSRFVCAATILSFDWWCVRCASAMRHERKSFVRAGGNGMGKRE